MSMMAMNRTRRDRKRMDSVTTVEAHGEGLLCFTADGSWFRGLMESTDDRYFDLCGTIVNDDFADKYPVLANLATDVQPLDDSMDELRPAVLLEGTAHGDDDGLGSSSSSSLPTMSDSPPTRRSPPLVRRGSEFSRSLSSAGSVISPGSFEAAMRALAEVPPGAPVTYDVHIRDHEEATECSVRFVPGWSGQDSCQLDSKELQFAAQKRYRGNKADMMIQRRLGPGLVGQGCIVFTGEMHIQYQYDYLATPKWCL